MKARWLTALIGIPIFLYLLVAGGLAWAAFLAICIVLSARELGHLFTRAGIPGTTYWIGAGGLLIFFAAYTSVGDGLPLSFQAGMPGLIVLAALARELFLRDHQPLRRAGTICLGSLYLGLYSFLYAVRVAGTPVALVAVIGTWATDTMAFFVGRAIGSHALAPNISPNKTREGAIAGLLGGMAAGFGVAILAGWPIWQGIVLGAGVGLGSQIGDLVESAMKREAQVKDSGALLPGHGGVLDRCDSLLFAGAVVYYLRLLFM